MYDFLVEDGTGVVGATSYATVAQADSFASFWEYPDWALLGVEDKEKLLIRASRLLDEQFTWRSHMLTKEQGLLFPRMPFVDTENRKVEGIPQDLVEATAEIAILLEDHNPDDLDKVKTLVSQSYGDSSEEYLGGWQENVTPFVSAFQKIAARLKRFGYGGKTLKQVTLIRG
jgi:hypothetical protein